MKISVSTLGCPAWTLSQILANCRDYGYDAIELRGIQNDLDLTVSPHFSNKDAIEKSRAHFADLGLSVSAVDCSAQLASAMDIDKSRAEARAATDLAAALNAPFIRVFGGELTGGESHRTASDRLVKELLNLGDYAYETNVTVLLENHDTFVTGVQVADVLRRVEHPSVAALWDVHNSVAAGEPLSTSISALLPFLRFVHVKDLFPEGIYCLLGNGDIPIRECVSALIACGYDGYISVEWEKRWQPGLSEPEIVFPQYARVLKEYIALVPATR